MQRELPSESSPVAEAPSSVREALSGSGESLDTTSRNFFAPQFGRDLSRVRVHTDAKAAASARAVGAHAYTVGPHMVFAGGRYDPISAAGRGLLAHELAHVVQQEGSEWFAGAPLKIGGNEEGFESEASEASRTSGATAPASASARELTLQKADAAGPAPAPAAGKQTPAPAAKTEAREVTAIKLDYRENGGLGRFDTLLYNDCTMMAQFRMNFNFIGSWPNEKAKNDWRDRFIGTVQAGWSRQFGLEATGECRTGCPKVAPFIQIFAPHSSPHVVVDVTYTDQWIQSRAGYGTAKLDSLDLNKDEKGGPEEQVGALHEFGHLTGRPDKYRPGNTCAPGYPKEGVMCMGSTITNEDYEPFAHALNDMTGCSYKVGASLQPPKRKESHAGLGGLVGGLAGTATGAAIGSAFGPLGIGIGAMAGLAVGAGAGALVGSAI